MELRREREALRPETPKHAPVEETALAGKLVRVRHTAQLKIIGDVIRVVCANVEGRVSIVV
ncbi:hypothetical protein BH11MYX2_BH11MYX2_32900 [soil metagenome]